MRKVLLCLCVTVAHGASCIHSHWHNGWRNDFLVDGHGSNLAIPFIRALISTIEIGGRGCRSWCKLQPVTQSLPPITWNSNWLAVVVKIGTNRFAQFSFFPSHRIEWYLILRVWIYCFVIPLQCVCGHHKLCIRYTAFTSLLVIVPYYW